jgi:hypothetical protein
LYSSLNETISDSSDNSPRIVGLPTGGRFRRPNSCYHERTERFPLSGGQLVFTFSTDPGKTYTLNNAAADTYDGFASQNFLSSPTSRPDIDWLGLSAEAWQAMYPSMSSGAPSLVNFLLELKDIGRLASLGKLGFLTDLSKSFRRRKTAEYFANAHLNWSFGVRPFIADVQQIVSSLISAKQRLEDLKKGSGKMHRAYWSKPLTTAPLWDNSGTYEGIQNWRATAEYTLPPVYRACAYYTYSFSDFGALATVGAFLDRLGVRLDPSIVWNAIPFSFIVDWFVDVGSWLRQFSADNTPMTVVLWSFTHSVKYRRMYTFSRSYGTSVPMTSWWCATSDVYERRVTIPRMWTSLRPGAGVTPSRVALAGSLSTVRTRKR